MCPAAKRGRSHYDVTHNFQVTSLVALLVTGRGHELKYSIACAVSSIMRNIANLFVYRNQHHPGLQEKEESNGAIPLLQYSAKYCGIYLLMNSWLYCSPA